MKPKFNNTYVGIAPIGWTNDDLPDLGKENTFQQAISEMALAGFEGTEIGSQFPKDLKILQKHLQMRNLQIASAWFSSFVIDKGLDATMTEFKKHVLKLKELGAKVVVVSEQSKSIQGNQSKAVFQDKPHFDDAEFAKLAHGLNEMGKWSHSVGVELCYHHHMGTGIQTWEETKKLLDLTDPKYVNLIFDTGHFSYSGENISEIVPLCVDRIKHVHLKDIRQKVVDQVKSEQKSFLEGVRLGTFTVPGDGDVFYDTFFEVLAKNNYSGWLLVEAEQDPSKANPFEYALKAMQFIKNKIEWKG
ncbi:myo-inosose-2 dehydratase [Candidatus Mycoplasma pogonae]